jgi:hypothetical protein
MMLEKISTRIAPMPPNPDHVEAAQEQDAHRDADDHAEGAEVGFEQQQQADQRHRGGHRHEALGQLVHVLLLAHREVGRVQHRHHFHDLGRLADTHGQPAARAVDRNTDARHQHQGQQDQGDDEHQRRQALPGRDRNAEHEQAAHQRDRDEHRLAQQEVVVLAAQVGELGRIRQRDRGRIHHHHPEQHQQDHDPDQRLVVLHHARRPCARGDRRVAGTAAELEGNLEAHQISCPFSSAISRTASTNTWARWA